MSPQTFLREVKRIENLRMQDAPLSLYDLWIEACDNYNRSLQESGRSEASDYHEGAKNAYALLVDNLGRNNSKKIILKKV